MSLDLIGSSYLEDTALSSRFAMTAGSTAQAFSGWVYADTLAEGSGFLNTVFFVSETVASAGDGWGLSFGKVSGVPQATLFTVGANTGNINVGSHLSTATWAHVLAVYNQATTTLQLYVNNNLVYNNTSYINTSAMTTPEIRFGANQTPGNYWDGRFAEFAMFSGIPDASQRAALAAGASPAVVTPTKLIEHWPFVRQRHGLWTGSIPTITGTVNAAVHPRVLVDLDSWSIAPWSVADDGASEVIGAVLSQSTSAGYPDRPTGGGVGLLVTLTEGGRGAIIERDLGQEEPRLHNRLAINPASISGGTVTILVGLDAEAAETFRVRYDPATRQVEAVLAGGPQLDAELVEPIDWHCVEFGFDAATGDAELWVNGVSVASATDDLSDHATRTLWFGAPYKAVAAIGDLYLDEWAIADGYIGPVVCDPIHDHAGDPARWLVVYNRASDDSAQWAATYRQRRGIPLANLLGLDLPADEQINESQFVAMRDAIAEYLTINGLGSRVMGVLIGHGVPGACVRADLQVDPIASEIERIDGLTGPASNLLVAPEVATMSRPNVASLAGDLLTARIDGATLNDSIAMTDRAQAIEAQPLGADDDAGATIWLDPYTPASSLFGVRRSQMLAWAAGADRQRLRLPLQMPDDPAPADDAEFDSIHDDAFFWGWNRATPPPGFFAAPAGRRVFAAQLAFSVATGPTLRNSSDPSWAAQAIAAGYAATMGGTRAYTASAVPMITPFFEALRRGWTIAEAWRVASPVLRSGLALFGDPLTTVATPRAGWDVFGPFDSLDRASFDEPIARLRPSEQQFPIAESDRPSDGDRGIYVVRRVDSAGRSEAGVRLVRVQRSGDASLPAATEPCWPAAPGWWPLRTADAWVVFGRWAEQFGRQKCVEVQLVEQVQGAAESAVSTIVVAAGDTEVRFERIAAGEPVRYRLAAIAASGASTFGPWSAWLTSSTTPTVQLALI